MPGKDKARAYLKARKRGQHDFWRMEPTEFCIADRAGHHVRMHFHLLDSVDVLLQQCNCKPAYHSSHRNSTKRTSIAELFFCYSFGHHRTGHHRRQRGHHDIVSRADGRCNYCQPGAVQVRR